MPVSECSIMNPQAWYNLCFYALSTISEGVLFFLLQVTLITRSVPFALEFCQNIWACFATSCKIRRSFKILSLKSQHNIFVGFHHKILLSQDFELKFLKALFAYHLYWTWTACQYCVWFQWRWQPNSPVFSDLIWIPTTLYHSHIFFNAAIQLWNLVDTLTGCHF